MEATFFMKSITGEVYTIKLDSQEQNPAIISKQIQSQLPESYNNENFKVICEGKDLIFFDFFRLGVGNYFSKLAAIYVIGNSDSLLKKTNDAIIASSDQKVKLKLLERLRKFEEKGFIISKQFTMDSPLNQITHELALLHVLNDMQKAEISEDIPVRQCIAHGCGNYLSPDEDLRCKICEY